MPCDVCKSSTRKPTQRIAVELLTDVGPWTANLRCCDRCLGGTVRAVSALPGASITTRALLPTAGQ